MSLSILNNIAALYAENNLTSTQASLQTTLQQLSSGSRINSGADDPAGLAVSDGLGANEAALTQSSQNASDGIGLLQTADGALSQVTSLLDQAVTLATESANGTLTSGQVSSANQEYQNILSQIGNIGATTNFNSSNVFSASATNIVVSDGTSAGLNTYADTVGALTTASVGTTAAAAVTTSSIAPTSTTSPSGAVVNTAGQYTFSTNAPSDTVSGKFTYTVGSGTPASVNVAAGTTLTALKNQLNGTTSFTAAGLSASISSGNLVILGPTSGANAAANTVSFAGTNLDDVVSTAVNVNNGITAAAPTQTTSSLTFSGTGVAAADQLSGSITYQVGNGSVQTFNLEAGSTINAGAPTDVSAQLNADATFQSYGLTASVSGTTVTVKGPAGNSENIVLGTGSGTAAVKDTTHSGIVTTNNSVTGAAGTAGTDTLTFATANSVVTGSISINGESISGANAQAIHDAINADTNLQMAGITATISSNVVTIHGNATTGTAPTIGANSLSDSGLGVVATTSGTTAGIANTSLAAFSSGSAGVVGGTIVIGGNNINITASSTGNSVATQINTAMKTAGTGITASFDAATKILTINGNASGAALPAIDATGLTDSGDVGYSNAITPGPAAQVAIQSVQTLTPFSATTAVITGSITVGGSTVDMGSTPMDGSDLATALNTNGLTAAGESATWDATTKQITITGTADGDLTPTITSNLSDSGAGAVTATTVDTAQQLVVGSTSLAAFSSPTGAVVGGSITVDGHEVDITAGSTGASVKSQINTALSTTYSIPASEMSASYDASTGVLTINGASDGSGPAPSVVSNLTDSGDEHPYSGTLTPNSTVSANNVTMAIGASDTLSGNITINGNLVSGATSAATLVSAINTAGAAAGIVANYNAGTSTLTINANPSAGVPIGITGNNLVDATKEAVNPAAGTVAVAGTKTTSSIALGDTAQAGDVITGNITYTDSSNGVLNTFNIAAGTTLDNNGTTGLSTLLNANATFQALGLTASVTGTTLTIKGAAGSTNTIALGAGTLTDVTNNLVGAATNDSVNGNAGTAATKTLVLNSATDTFGGSININSNGAGNVAVDLAGLDGQQAALAITNNATLFGQGVSAGWNANSKTLTINGNGTGESLVVGPVTTISDNAAIAAPTATTNATGGPATGATSTITLGGPNDTVSGNLRLVVGTSGLAKDTLSLNIAPNTTGAALASQINGDSAFQAAGVSAAYNSNTYAVTLTGPNGSLTDTLDTSGTSLTDSTSAVPQGGANFTASTVSTLTAQTAATVLTTVTAAVADVAYQRGTIGADVNELTSASNVASAEEVNLTSAQDTITATDYGQAASNLSKYQILSQTGISALAQANSVQQEVLKLLQ